MRRLWGAAIVCLLVLVACVHDRPSNTLEQSLTAIGVSPSKAAVLIIRLEDGQRWQSGGSRLDQRFVAASTSKIPHTLIALETGVVRGADQTFKWDGQQRFLDSWNEDQTFADAFQRSTVWIYQSLTPRIGSVTLSEWLSAFAYGNADTGGPERVSDYWLVGPLRISAVEQVAFLTRLQTRALPLSETTYEAALPMMVERVDESWALYAKSGWKSIKGETDIGWYVGWLEQTGGQAPGTYVFAMNMDMETPENDIKKRRSVVYQAFADIGAW